MIVQGNIVDIQNKRIFKGEVEVKEGKIIQIREVENTSENYILPGFIDAHIHIESSMLVPSEFAKIAVTHGTVATVSDPHEIANVLGVKGVDFMIENNLQRKVKDEKKEFVEFLTSDRISGIKTIENGIQSKKGTHYPSDKTIEINFNEYLNHLITSDNPKSSPSFNALSLDVENFKSILESETINFDSVSQGIVMKNEDLSSKSITLTSNKNKTIKPKFS